MSETRRPLRLGLYGRGRLGTAIAAAAESRDGFEVAWSLGRDGEPSGDADVLVDASVAEAVPAHLDRALATQTPLVIGATGWEIPDLARRVGESTGVLVAPNFSIGAALQRRLAGVLAAFASADPEADPYVVERHHRGKADAPSGTARLLAEAMLAACPRKTEWTLVAGAVAPHELAVSSVRAGAEFGSHTVGIDSPAEVLEITHRARSRAAYGAGALAAAEWIHTRRGLHAFDAVVAGLLDPLLSRDRKGGG